MLTKFWHIFFSLCFFSPILRASSPPLYFNHFQVGEGLANNAVFCSAQDEDGFLWFGTRDGLSRFDGYRFKNFIHEPGNSKSVGSNLILCLQPRNTNELWVGTDQGIYIYDTKLEKFSSFDKISREETLQISEDKKGNMWFISNNRLYKYIPSLNQVDHQYAKRYQQNTYAFCIDQNDEIWIGLDQEICHVKSGKKYAFDVENKDAGRIEVLHVDASNNIWIGTSRSGVHKFVRHTTKTEHVVRSKGDGPLYIRDIKQINETQMWMATENGLIVYNMVLGSITYVNHEKDNPWSLSDNAGYTILKDNQGGVWVGTYFGGVNYYHTKHNRFEKIFPRNSPHSIDGHAVREIVEDSQNNLWIGTEDQGLSYWDQKTNQFLNFGLAHGLSHTNIHGLLITGDSLLIGTFFQGLDILDIRSKKVIKHYDVHNTNGALGNNFVYHIYRTSDAKILLATSPGIYQFIPGEDLFIPYEVVPSHIFYTSMYEDRQRNLWLTSWRDGLYKISKNKNKPEVFLHDPENDSTISSNRVNRVFQDSKGQIWVATEGGLCLYDEKQNSFKRFTIKEGLPSNLILSVLEDDNANIWISTTKGLVKMDISSHCIETYSLEHGLLDLQFNYNSCFKDSKGIFYFGAFKGLIRFDPTSLSNKDKTNTFPPIYITGIQVNQIELTARDTNKRLSKSILYTDKIQLSYEESSISLDFVALNFASAKSTSYLYRLVGLDTAWTFSRDNTKAIFPKLRPGKYKFEVMAADANKTPISNVKSLEIEILPPYWASIPAFISYVLISLGILGRIFYSYDRKIKEKNRNRLNEIKAHREKELYRAKMDFFAQVTHDIKTPLTLIKAPLENIIEGGNPQKSAKWLKIIQENTDKLLLMTDNLLDFRKIESDQFSLQLKRQCVSELVSTCIKDFAPLIETRGIKLATSVAQDIYANVDIEAIYKILSNLLSNAIKYADKEIYLILTKQNETSSFCIQVKNDGKLLREEEIAQIFEPFQRASSHYRVKGSGLGLALASSFATLHGGTLIYKKNSENLNIFVLDIPL